MVFDKYVFTDPLQLLLCITCGLETCECETSSPIIKRDKRCPDCFMSYSSEYDLFNHRLNECKPNRAISIVKIAQPNNELKKTEEIMTNKSTKLFKGVKMYYCDACGSGFDKNWNLKRHKISCYRRNGKPQSDGVDSKQNLCKKCKRRNVREKDDTECYYCMSIGKKKYICNGCGLNFARQFNLKRHQTESCPAFKKTKQKKKYH